MSTNVLKGIGTYKADEVAKCLVKVADSQTKLGIDPDNNKQLSEGVTNLKLQKMLYFADAVNLAVNGKALIDEDFEAWDLGPVLKSIYRIYKPYNNSSIQPESDYVPDAKLEKFLIEVWKVFGKYSATELVNFSHKTGSPWDASYKKGKNTIIPKKETKEYYKKYFKIETNV